MKTHTPLIHHSWLRPSLVAACALLGAMGSQAHISYTGRDFGTFSDGSSAVTIINQAVTGDHGWADGTDADFGDGHKTRYYRFTLSEQLLVSLTFSGSTNSGTKDGSILPGFSIYEGLAHLPPFTPPQTSADYDYSLLTADYLASLGGVAKEGAFVALDTWKVGGDGQIGPVFDYGQLTTFTYMGHAVDGTSANYGAALGIVGDGLADGTVTGSFLLDAGTYSIFVGGANYSGGNAVSYGLTGSLSVAAAPEPGRISLMALAGCGLLLRRRRK